MSDDHDHDNSHEETPLLTDQQDNEEERVIRAAHENAHDSSHSPLERVQDFVDGFRNVVENEIPNGHHNTPPSSPRKIHALLPRLFTLINSLVDSPNVEDDIITDDVVEFMAGLGREVVYGLLRCVETFLEEGERDVGRKRLLERRAGVAQIAAAAVTKVFVDKDMMATYCHVLTRPFYAIGEERNTAENAIEIAIRVHATDFLADIEVQRCVQALWNGLILQTEDEECRVRFVEYSGVRRSRHHLWEWVDVGRLNVPKYQNNLKIFMFILFLITYTIVVNDRPEKGGSDPTVAEWIMYTFVFGYIFEEFRLIFEGGTAFFLGSIWHWVNIISYSLFLVAFVYRFVACYVTSVDKTIEDYNDNAYDLLALLAVFLWVKTLSLLDGLQYFGTMIMVLQKMLKDGIMFFWLLSWVFIGFLQSFYALAEDKDKSLYVSCMLLLRGFLQDPDFDIAAEMNKDKGYYGVWLFCLYLFLTSIILLNLLVALFNSSYTNITDSAEKEYLALFTFKVFSYLKSPDQFPYAAPFNLIEVFLVIPWSVCVSRKTYGRINKVIMSALFGVPVLLIARGERSHYLKLKSTNENDDIQGGRRVYRYLTNENDDDVDDLFLLATQEFEDGHDSVEGVRPTTAGQAEEGMTTENDDIWKTTLSPKETFEEFRVRRNKDREAKAALAQRKLQAENESRASRTDAPITSGSSQLTDTLVQSLLASLARMESRQKDLETMLESHLATDKESSAIAQAKAAATTIAIEAAATEDEQEVPEERGDEEQ
ncbi:hypothetical protein CPC16_003707 [Podila verticillata]|nr:hypothetical protein CPC16_003707 [Podila verticillata]KAI9233902.1 MAG: hypothetical protein BYD32DRAFT_464918 [Podila humilis]